MYKQYKKLRQRKNDFQTFEIPYDLMEKSPGIAVDFGESSIKIAYRDQRDWEEAQNSKDKKYAKIRLVSFDRSDFEKASDFLVKNIADLRKSENDVPLVTWTGSRCQHFVNVLSKTMNVKMIKLAEIDCFVNTFHHLSHSLPRHKILQDLPQDGIDVVKKTIEETLPMSGNFTEFSEMSMDINTDIDIEQLLSKPTESANEEENTTPLHKDEQIFPCLLVILGSQFSYIKVEADGNFSSVDISTRGGATFLGLGAILTGAESFEELMVLVERGNHREVDIFTGDLAGESSESEQTDVYASIGDFDEIIYCFGKGVESKPGQFKSEDLAKALLHAELLDITSSCYLAAMIARCERIFFCGSFCDHPLIRSWLTELFLSRIATMKFFGQIEQYIKMDFIDKGSFYGSLGAFLNEGIERP